MSPSAPRDGKKSPSPVNAAPPDSSDPSAANLANEDRELVERLQRGDRQAFRELFDKYQRRVFAVALQVVKNPHDAGEVVQETFMRVYRYLPGFRFECTFRSWLFRVATNVAIDRMRKQARTGGQAEEYEDGQKARESDTGDPASPIGAGYLGGDPARLTNRKELQERVQKALGELSALHSEILLLRDVDGLSYEEIAEALEVKKGTVMSRLFYARRKMQAALAGYLAESEPGAGSEPGEEQGGSDDTAR